jgi:uncharacterized protein YegL
MPPGDLALDPTALARRQLQVMFALDFSGSMQGDRIASLNYAMRTALPELAEVAAENPEIDVRVRVLRFADAAEWQSEAASACDYVWHDLAADGETNMGAALHVLAQALSPDEMTGRQLPPVIVLASDGLPTDEYDEALAEFFAAPFADSAVRVAIAIGTDADLDPLDRFIRHPTARPLRASNATELVNRIKWATTAPVKAVSSPTTGPDPLATMGRGEPSGGPQTEIIW